MDEIINQYELLTPFHSENAGSCTWTYARKMNKNYFLKAFNDPVYITDESISYDTRRQNQQECQEYEEAKKEFYEAVNRASHGNIVRISEFFRCDNHYYVATERIIDESISISDIQNEPFENRILLCKAIAYEMMHLHAEHIVHADIKENNILVKRTKQGKLIGKIIDFDAGFFEDNPPEDEELGGDQVYLSPEACRYMCGDETAHLTCKMDVFALGLLFHQYITGSLPYYDTNEYDYACESVLDGQELQPDPNLSLELCIMIYGMLECEPEKRLSMAEVYSKLENYEMNGKTNTGKNTYETGKVYGTASSNETANGSSWFHSPGDL